MGMVGKLLVKCGLTSGAAVSLSLVVAPGSFPVVPTILHGVHIPVPILLQVCRLWVLSRRPGLPLPCSMVGVLGSLAIHIALVLGLVCGL